MRIERSIRRVRPLAVYGVWLLVLAIMSPLCAVFARFKQRHQYWWLSYI